MCKSVTTLSRQIHKGFLLQVCVQPKRWVTICIVQSYLLTHSDFSWFGGNLGTFITVEVGY